jgi:CBS domain containing-hemolysin-like protein
LLYLVLILAVILVVLAALLSAAETAVMVLPPGRVHRLVEAEARGAEELDRLASRPYRLRAASALAFGLACAGSALLGALVGARLPGIGGSLSEVLAVIVLVLITFAVAGSLPRTLAVANPERVGLDSALPARVAVAVLYPVARMLGAPWAWLVDVVTGERAATGWATAAEYRSSDTDEETEREEAEEALLEAVSDFAEKVAREVMVPRTDVTALPETATTEDAVRVIQETGYTRLPVYRETIDDVRGVLYAKDLLVACTLQGGVTTVRELARPPYFVPETKPVEELLLEMRTRTHIAIVADEYGGTAGIVTLEDLLEEIVGDISDEYDREEPLLTQLSPERYRVDARLPVDELNELFGTDIDTEADSVGGLFTEVAGRIPQVGESLTIEGLRLTVDVLEGTRIRQLSVEPAETDERIDDA